MHTPLILTIDFCRIAQSSHTPALTTSRARGFPKEQSSIGLAPLPLLTQEQGH